MYKQPLGDGKHDITCSWVDEHTNAVDSGTAYFEPDDKDERGEINRRRLGWWIRRHAGRIVDGLRFVRSSTKLSAGGWCVESVLSVSNGEYAKSVTDTDSASKGYH